MRSPHATADRNAFVALRQTLHIRLTQEQQTPPTAEQAMILFTSSTQNIAAPAAGGWSLRAIVRDMLNAWLAHHQRVADIGGAGHL
jgi:hypothetical protein